MKDFGGGSRDGQKTWNALYSKDNSNSKEERRACYEKLVSFQMEDGVDPDYCTIKRIEIRRRLHEMEEKLSDDRFKIILVQGLTDDYEFVKMTNFHSSTFGVNVIKLMTRNLYTDHISRPGYDKKLAFRGSGNDSHQMDTEGTMPQMP